MSQHPCRTQTARHDLGDLLAGHSRWPVREREREREGGGRKSLRRRVRHLEELDPLSAIVHHGDDDETDLGQRLDQVGLVAGSEPHQVRTLRPPTARASLRSRQKPEGLVVDVHEDQVGLSRGCCGAAGDLPSM